MQDDVVVRRKESLQLWYLMATNAKCSSTAATHHVFFCDRCLIHAGSRRDGIASNVPGHIRNIFPAWRTIKQITTRVCWHDSLIMLDSATRQFSERDQSVQIENVREKIASKIQNAFSCRHSAHSTMFDSQKSCSNRDMPAKAYI